jgi:hypothetical protein
VPLICGKSLIEEAEVSFACSRIVIFQDSVMNTTESLHFLRKSRNCQIRGWSNFLNKWLGVWCAFFCKRPNRSGASRRFSRLTR